MRSVHPDHTRMHPAAPSLRALALLCAIAVTPLVNGPLSAQQAIAPRIALPADLGFDHAAFLAGYERDIEPERVPARRAPAIRGQLPAGFAGLLVGTVLGMGTGLMIAMGQPNGDSFETAALIPMIGGMLGGTTYGVYRYSKAKGLNGRAAPTFGGAALGLLGGPLLWVTVPIGARWAYNRSRTDSLAPAPSTSAPHAPPVE